MYIQQIDLNKIGIKGESKQDSFEDLCMFLCCREFKITEIDAYKNQPGIESEPLEVRGEKIGFQVKFFDSKFDWSQIEHSIVGKKLDKSTSVDLDILYPNNVFKNYSLTKLYIYSNKDKTLNGRKKTNTQTLLENLSKKHKCKIYYVTEKNLKLKLAQPSNLDLAQLYFGIGDELYFIKNSTNPNILTFLQSSEYLELPFIDKQKNQVDKIADKIISETQKDFLIVGNPGSGKSILMHKLLQVFGGLDQVDESKMIKRLTSIGAVPILINLKNCATDSLENILRGRKNDCKINNQELGFIYLFDGLDELKEENADNVLSHIYELNQKSNTKKIIISCRIGNINKIKVRIFFKTIIEYSIANLEEQFLDNYFNAKNNPVKIKYLQNIKKNNEILVREIKDIIIIKFFWETIQQINDSSTILDLFSEKIDLLLNSRSHRKNIDELNLLNPKREKILALNQEIAFEFQKKFQFRFRQKDLQNLILKKFNRLDYKSVNTILHYIADLFFDNSDSFNFDSSTTYIYQHRRYQEYFFAQKLKIKYEENPIIIRKLNVLSNRDFFEELFLKYLRKEYKKENNLPGLIELNLIDVYLGKHKGFGVDDAYYMNSSEFLPSLVRQKINIFNELFEDENLQLKEKISIDFNEVENIALLWKSEKQDIANEFKLQLKKIFDLFDPEKLRDCVYFRLVIKDENIKDVFDNLIRKNYENFSDESSFGLEKFKNEKLLKSFFRTCLIEKKEELFKLFDDFNEYEFIALLDIFKSIEYLPVFIESQSIHDKIKTFVESYSQTLTEKNYFILFYKKYFNLILSKEDEDFARNEFSRLKDKININWDKTHVDIALINYVLDELFSFENFLKKQEGHPFRYYNELGLYAALFKDFLDLLKNNKSIEAIIRDYIRYINFYVEKNHIGSYLNLKEDISFLWANIFANSNASQQSKLNLKNRLITEENNIIPFSFYLQLNRINTSLFNQLVNESELRLFEDSLSSWKEDFPSYVDMCFNLSMFFSMLDNSSKAKFYFIKGINDGILRHGWRKDHIVSYSLVKALEILWKNNWESKNILKKYTEEVFNLALRVSEITDGKRTRIGPYNVIKLVASYEINLAEEFKKKLIENEYYEDFSNSVITSVLLGKVKLGLQIAEVETEMNEYKYDYNPQGKQQPDYYEQKFKVYLEIAESDLYTDEEKVEAFNKINEQIEEIKKQEIDYFLRDIDFKDDKKRFKLLCEKYQKEFNLEFDEETKIKNPPDTTEKAFLTEVKEAETKQQIKYLYQKLGDYNNEIVLSQYESWEALVRKTFKIYKNIELFINLLKENSFPHIDWYTSNSKYFYLGLAVALKNIDTRQETLNYLSQNTGHDGFVNVMKSYEVNKDKQMCLLLFNRYLKFCRLIVN